MRRAQAHGPRRWLFVLCAGTATLCGRVYSQTFLAQPLKAARQDLHPGPKDQVYWVCHVDSDECAGIQGPLTKYSERSVWFERKAIIITAVFLALFVVMFTALAVVLRDATIGLQDDDDESICSRSESMTPRSSSTPFSTAPRRTRLLFRRRRAPLRKRVRRIVRSSRTNARDSDTSRGSEDDNVGAPDRPDSPLPAPEPAIPNTNYMVSTPGPESEAPPAAPGTSASAPPQASLYPSTTVNSDTIDQSDIEAVDAWPINAAAVPPQYGASACLSAPGTTTGKMPLREESADLSPPSSQLSGEPDEMAPPPLPPAGVSDTTTFSAHIATDDKSALRALHMASSAPPTDGISLLSAHSLTTPSAPDAHVTMREQVTPEETHFSDVLPAPPAPMQTSYDMYASLTHKPHLPTSAKAQEAEAERAQLATLIPSKPGEALGDLPHYAAASPRTHIREAPAPSAPLMDETSTL